MNRIWAVVKTTSQQLGTGLKVFLKDRNRYREITQLVKQQSHLPENRILLSDYLHLHLYRRNITRFRTVTLPVLILFCVPFVGYLTIPAILYSPTVFLTGPLLNKAQRKELRAAKHSLRKRHFSNAIISFQENVAKNEPDKLRKLHQICKNGSDSSNPCEVISDVIELCQLESNLSLSQLNKSNLVELGCTCGIKHSYWIPSKILLNLIYKRLSELQALLDCLRHNFINQLDGAGGDGGIIASKQHSILLKKVLHELLHEHDWKDNDDIEVYVERLTHFSSILNQHTKHLPRDMQMTFFIHGLIYLASKQPNPV